MAKPTTFLDIAERHVMACLAASEQDGALDAYEAMDLSHGMAFTLVEGLPVDEVREIIANDGDYSGYDPFNERPMPDGIENWTENDLLANALNNFAWATLEEVADGDYGEHPPESLDDARKIVRAVMDERGDFD